MILTATQRRTLSWLALAGLAAVVIWLLAPVLTPFLVAAFLAYGLQPAVEWLVARRVPRVLAALLMEVATIVAVLALLLLIVPILSTELPLMRDQIPVLADRLNRSVVPWLERMGIHAAFDVASIKAFVLKYLDANLAGWLATALTSARIGGSFLLALLGNAVLMPVALFYLLVDWPQMIARLRQLVPPRWRAATDDFIVECDSVLGQYLRGQLLVMLLLAALYSVGLALFGFELAVPVGVFTGLAVFIPYIGFGLGLALALLAAVLQFDGWHGLIGVAVVYGVGQVVETAYLTPRLVGERIGMNPLTVIFVLLAFGHLFGFVGVLIALPVSALLVVACRRLHAQYVTSSLYGG